MKIRINKEKIGINILITSLAISGLISITAGAITNKMTLKKETHGKVKIKVIMKSSANKDVEPKLKNIEIEVNMPLSVNVKDYIENASKLDKATLKKCKLDTSLVNVNEVGTYTYQITYRDKKYNGTVKVKEKENAIEKLTLKDINITVGQQLPQNISDYVTEDLTDDVKNEITFDTSKVDITKAGIYNYTVTYKNTIYQGRITVVENKPAQTAQAQTQAVQNQTQTQSNQSGPAVDQEAIKKAKEEEAKKKAEEEAKKKAEEEAKAYEELQKKADSNLKNGATQ